MLLLENKLLNEKNCSTVWNTYLYFIGHIGLRQQEVLPCFWSLTIQAWQDLIAEDSTHVYYMIYRIQYQLNGESYSLLIGFNEGGRG